MINLLIITTELVVTTAKTVTFERLHGELEDKDRDKKLYRLARARIMRVCDLDQVKSSRTRMKRFWCYNKFGPRPDQFYTTLEKCCQKYMWEPFQGVAFGQSFWPQNIEHL